MGGVLSRHAHHSPLFTERENMQRIILCLVLAVSFLVAANARADVIRGTEADFLDFYKGNEIETIFSVYLVPMEGGNWDVRFRYADSILKGGFLGGGGTETEDGIFTTDILFSLKGKFAARAGEYDGFGVAVAVSDIVSPVGYGPSFPGGGSPLDELLNSLAIYINNGVVADYRSGNIDRSGNIGGLSNFFYGFDSHLFDFSQIRFEFLASGEFIQLDFLAIKRNTDTTPEPATLALMGLGLVGAGLVARRRRKK